ncbi:hypothetical protein GCM10008018_41320 [Paenibacillus marchantiophytorum]|uniref:Endospore appendages core domain-containing protein n=1 Tax=Paenibacillus marchantiophytorum TaxID=1619310 RepID=A0ABQ1EXS3_9BACL|nr:S-Ena type endospore appendage [Paenibacillus marchantiophytorum]GFZ90661.1 hypothetical protein GCM10008018_41320 [Paenibacillus marchantiophytorum]
MACNSTSTALTCCSDKNYVQDKVCTPWSGTVVAADVLIVAFTNNLNQNIVGTGYLQYDVGPANITLDFLDSAGNPINATLTLAPGTSLAFTYRRFSVIQITLPAATAGTYQGEFCITTRYPIQ